MTGRRRYPRFQLAAPLEGSLRVREEVAIEHWGLDEIELDSAVPCGAGEELVLEVPGNGVGQFLVTVLDSRPFVSEEGAIRHRVRMRIRRESPSAEGKGPRQS
jgi:hypothetical protein